MIENNSSLFSRRGIAVLFALITSMLWGILYPFIKIGYRAFAIDTSNIASLLLFAGIRFFLSGLILVCLFSLKEKKLDLPRGNELISIIKVSLFTVILHYAFTYSSISLCDSSKTSVIKQIGFLILPCVVFLFRRDDKFSVRKVVGAVLGFLSVIVINIEGMKFDFGIGEMLAVLASFSSAFGQILSKNVYDKYSPARTVAYSQLIGGLILMITGLVFGGAIGKLDFESLLVLTFICVASISANLIWNTLIKHNDMSKLAVLKSTDPLFASLFSGILLNENILRAEYLFALVLVIVAIILGNQKKKYG